MAHTRNVPGHAMHGSHRRRPAPRSGASKVISCLLALVFVGACVWGVAHILDMRAAVPSLPAGQSAEVTIAENEGLLEVANHLEEAGVIGDTGKFVSLAKASGLETTLIPGTYTIAGGLKPHDVIALLKGGPNSEPSLVIPEGYTITRVAYAVEAAYEGAISKEEFLKEAHNASAYVDEYPFVQGVYDDSLEGFLFPKSYPVRQGYQASDVIRQMLDQYSIETQDIDWSYAKSKNLTEYDIVILASIIEREADENNRPLVSSVFYNRLSERMPLQSDATVAYVIDRDPRPADLQIESPYNTYKVPGLPAGPICSPGLASIQAAAHPEESDYLYFYFAKRDGVMEYYFSTTLEEHNRAIAQSE